MQNSLKFFKTKNVYKNSTGTVVLDMNTLTASSYGHWVFLKQVNGHLLFNTYRYSVTTSSHQRVVRYKLIELGLNFIEVNQPGSL